jgi:thiol-disulfide isomerase/thioredoxin
VSSDTEPPAPPPWVLMINGGATREQNYQSHLLQLRHLVELLRSAGVPRERFAIFAGDGAEKAADLALKEVQPERDAWLLDGTHLARRIAMPITYANSEVPGFTLGPATKAALRAWFARARKHIRAGDTLLLYVTDHGTKNPEDLANNRISLWGKDESLSVKELRALLEQLDPGVRVVALMSQCFSGAFARLASTHAGDGEPRGDVCGYYSSTADRPAYGCYPENRGRDNVGHSFHFIHALAESRSFSAAHVDVLVSDHTPDVPLRSSDVYLQGVLGRAAQSAKVEPDALADELLRTAWRDKGAWEADIRLLDRIGQAFGVFSPRSLAELDQQAKQLPDIGEQLKTHGKAWKAAQEDLAEANLNRFLAGRRHWRDRLADPALDKLDGDGARGATRAVLTVLRQHTESDDHTMSRLTTLRDKAETANAAAYRMEIRAGAVLRMRALLTTIAGRVYVSTRGTPAEREAYEALRRCEDLHIPDGDTPAELRLASAEPLPSYEDDVGVAREVLPAWMGINFKPATPKQLATADLKPGAAAVIAVYPDSPARTAGLEPGDLVIGPPTAPFTEPHQIREWTMTSEIDRPRDLDVVRGTDRLRVTLVPKPYPLRWPSLPGPPPAGTPAPALSLETYRGTLPADGQARLLFFWATWCAPCKASLPEVLDFERERKIPVVAITDEASEQLDGFFKAWKQPFPATVAMDESRRGFVAYGVSGTPTFVLVDGKGRVEAVSNGYRPDKGLELGTWSWSKKPVAAAPAAPPKTP